MHTNEKRRELTESDVVFMYGAKDPETYRAYGTTVLAWGGAEKKEQVETCLRLGIHPTGAMWCLTAGFVTLKESAELREAVVRDIAGEPIEVPWLPEGRRNGQPNWWGCFHHPAFHEHLRRQVREVMAGGAHGLHVDDHLGTAHPAIEYGGCFCGYCMAEFRTFLQGQPEAVWKAAGIGSLDAFDYRELVRKHAMTREAYLKVQDCLPLRREFIEFQLRAAARNVRELHALAEEVAGRPVTLSANAWIPLPPHMVVTPLLTYIVCEVHQHAGKGLAHSGNAVTAYRLADALGKPLAATAAGTDWAFVAAHKAEQLVTYWIAQAYACGQRLMSPSRAWCYTPGTGTSFYAGPTEVYAPFYRFVRRHAALFDGYRAARAPAAVLFDPAGDFFGGGRLLGRMSALADAGIPFDVILAPNAWGLGDPASVAARCVAYPTIIRDERTLPPAPAWRSANPDVWVLPRIKPGALPVVHVLNRAYDQASDRFAPQRNVAITLAPELAAGCTAARLHRPEGDSLDAPVKQTAAGLEIMVPELQVWGLVELRG